MFCKAAASHADFLLHFTQNNVFTWPLRPSWHIPILLLMQDYSHLKFFQFRTWSSSSLQRVTLVFYFILLKTTFSLDHCARLGISRFYSWCRIIRTWHRCQPTLGHWRCFISIATQWHWPCDSLRESFFEWAGKELLQDSIRDASSGKQWGSFSLLLGGTKNCAWGLIITHESG